MQRQGILAIISSFLALFFLFAGDARAAEPLLPMSSLQLQDFVPKGMEVLMQAEGDLNKDGKSDAALILINPAEKVLPSVEDRPRKLVLLLQKPEGGYRLAASSENAILCRNCGGVFGDPLADMQISRGVLVIDHYAGSRNRWSYTHRWRYQDGDWVLIGETKASSDTFSPEAKNYDTNFLTGDQIVETTDSKGRTTVKKTRQPKVDLKKLSTFQFS